MSGDVAHLRERAAHVVRWARDQREERSRGSLPAAVDRPDLGLTGLQFYPEGTTFHDSLADTTDLLLDGVDYRPGQAVGSLGSCFAEEFAVHMRQWGATYPLYEENIWGFSADWGRVYTAACFGQIVRYSLDDDFPELVEEGPKGWFDPLREHGVVELGTTREAALERLRAHRRASRTAFESLDVLAVTLGQNESWVDGATGMHWGAHPKRLGTVPPDRFAPARLSFAECVTTISAALSALFDRNPGLRVVITVSPVPSHAVFTEVSAITGSMATKALLRAAVEEVRAAFPGRVFYFPSFEAALAYNPRTYRPDNRHVKRLVIERIFGMLERSLGVHQSRETARR